MKTEISIDGVKFLINGRFTYKGISYKGKPVEGLLFNSRMIQAIFDDECPETRKRWVYPDTGVWDPERNTDEFCRALKEYRRHGLLAVTVGLQGGCSIYSPDVYGHYINSAYEPDGTFKKPYFDRLLKVIKTGDDLGMIVIVNYFYFKHAARIKDDRIIYNITGRVTDWLLQTGYRNILVDVLNEAGSQWNRDFVKPENTHKIIEIVKSITFKNRRLLAGVSTTGGELPSGRWLETEDFSMPHGNGNTPDELTGRLRRLKEDYHFKKKPKPILINEDSVFIENLEAAISEYASWGFYCQGYGSCYKDLMDWTTKPRETAYGDLSGFQTVPVNWSINTPDKRMFFNCLKEITSAL